MADPAWLHGSLSRVGAEELLMNANHGQSLDGTFLIRASESVQGTYVLCLMYQARIHHYRIRFVNGKYSVQTIQGVEQVLCNSLVDLVAFYSKPGTGLVTHLGDVVPHDIDDSTDDSDDDHIREYAEPEEMENGAFSSADSEGSSSAEMRSVAKFFEQMLKKCNTSKVDLDFQTKFKEYAENGAVEDVRVFMGKPGKPKHFKDLVLWSASDLFRHMQVFASRLELMNDFYDTCSGGQAQSSNGQASSQADMSWESLMQTMSSCRNLLSSAEKKANHLMSTVGARYRDDGGKKQQLASRSSATPVMTFETRTDGTLRTKAILKVDVESGALTVSRGEKDSEPRVFEHKQVVQLIKSRSVKQKVGIKLEGKGRRDYIFSDNRSREIFCQLVHQMHRLHASQNEVTDINIFIGSFNMGDAEPAHDLESWFKSQGLGRPLDESLTFIPHDLYVIGTQESNGMKEADWISKVRTMILNYTGAELRHVANVSLWGIRLLILVKPEHYNKISHLQQSFVRTGVANTLGNKGAVGVSMYINGTSLCFICAHLTSGTEKCQRRNQNYRDIIRGLSLGRSSLDFDLTSQFHHVFWFGDLNYRLQSEDTEGAERIIEMIKAKDYPGLISMDQLTREKVEGNVFCSFEEEALEFPPTYRYAIGTRERYNYRKEKKMSVRINVPSYCDRVLWKSHPGMHIMNTSYGCTENIMTSDHSPVFSTFNVGVINQYTPSLSRPGSDLSKSIMILFSYACAMINTTSKTTFYLEVHSECLNAHGKSGSNAKWLDERSQSEFRDTCPRSSKTIYTTYPEWPSTQMERVVLVPIVADDEYLVQQHLFIAIKSSDGDEVYGGGVVALSSFFAAAPVQFDIEITRHGKATGFLRGRMHIPTRSQRPKPTAYETVNLISTEDPDEDLPLGPSTNARRPRLQSSGTDAMNFRGPMAPPSRPSPQSLILERGEMPSGPPPPPAKPKPVDRHRNQSLRDLKSPESDMGRKPRSTSSNTGGGPTSGGVERPKFPVPPFREQSSMRGAPPPPVVERMGRSSNVISPNDPNVPPPRPARASSQDHVLSKHHAPAVRTQSAGGSPLPARPTRTTSVSHPKNTDAPVIITTVQQLLRSVGLPQYAHKFVERGWDDVHFLSAMSHDDLKDCGVLNGAHQRMILDGIRRMKTSE